MLRIFSVSDLMLVAYLYYHQSKDKIDMSKGTALITGASAGLGAEFAKLFAQEGYDLALVARRKDRLEEIATSLKSAHSINARVIEADLGDIKAPQAIFEALAGVEVRFLVNNAGFGTNGTFAERELSRELEQIQVNVTSLTQLTRLFLPQMIARKQGRILNIGSTAGFQPGPFMAVYYATKAYVNHFSEALSIELKDTGVTATLSCPGATSTEFAKVAGNDKSKLFAQGAATAESVAKEAYRAMHAGKVMIVHGFKNKMGVQSLRFAPRAAVRAIAANLNK
jgi:short-subunit dehydrogenase